MHKNYHCFTCFFEDDTDAKDRSERHGSGDSIGFEPSQNKNDDLRSMDTDNDIPPLIQSIQDQNSVESKPARPGPSGIQS